jgi:hypothetical protein
VSKPPTPQAISALLREAGFPANGEYSIPGFTVVADGDSSVLAGCGDSSSGGILDAHCILMLGRYQEALEHRTGYCVRHSADGTYLIVTAREEAL